MLRRYATAVVSFACALKPNAATAQGQPGRPDSALALTLSEARSLGNTQNKQLSSARTDTAIARGELRQRRLLQFNPSADVLGVGKQAEFSLSQEVEIAGQRGLRVASGQANLERARGEARNAARTTIAAIDRAFYSLASATERAKLSEDVLDLSRRLASITERQLAAGEVSRLDYNLTVIELGRSRSRLLASERERRQANVDLALLIGASPATRISPVIESLDGDEIPEKGNAVPAGTHPHAARAARLGLDSLVAVARARRPDLAARAATVRQAKADVRLSQRELFPNLVLRGVSEPGDEDSRLVRGGIGITLPLFNRKQGEIATLRSVALKAEREVQALHVDMEAEIASELAAYQAAAEAVEILESTVLIPARQNRQLLETAYREGKVGVSVLLLIRNQVIDAELEYWEAWLAERVALANLLEATGENYLGIGEGRE